MTACVNKKSKRVAAVVTASLVGALSIGAPAVALAANANIDMLVSDEANAFTSGKIEAYTVNGEWTNGASLDVKSKPISIIATGEPIKVEVGHLLLANNDKKLEDMELSEDYKQTYVAADKDGKPGKAVDKIVDPGKYFVKVEAVDGKYEGGVVYLPVKVTPDDLGILTAFEVNPASESDNDDGDFVFTGSKLNIGIKNASNTTLVEGVDYEIKFLNDGAAESAAGVEVKNVGKYWAVVNGLGKYAGEKAYLDSFEVKPFGLAGNKVKVVVDPIIGSDNYAGASYTVTWTDDAGRVTVLDNAYTKLVLKDGIFGENTDYNNFKVVDADAADANVIGETKNVFTVSKFAKAATFKYDGSAWADTFKTVVADEDSDRFDVSKIVAFDEKGKKLDSKDLSVEVRNAAGAVVWSTSNQADVDWMTTPGVYTVKATYAGSDFNYGGTASCKVTVVADILDADAKVYVKFGDDTVDSVVRDWTGSDIMKNFTVVVKDNNGNGLYPNGDYTVEYKDSEGNAVDNFADAGEYTVEIKSDKYELTGTTVVKVTINKLDLSKLALNDATKFNYTFLDVKSGAVAIDLTKVSYTEGVDMNGNGKLDPTAIPTGAEIKLQQEQGDGTWKDVKKAAADKTAHYRAIVTAGNNAVEKSCVFASEDGTVLDFWAANSDDFKFADVKPCDWFFNAVAAAEEVGIMNGYGNRQVFGPNDQLKRGQVAVILYNMAGSEDINGLDEFLEGSYNELFGWTSFDDVNGKEYYGKAIAWAKQAGVVNGYADGTFRPESYITREEFAAMLANFAKKFNEFDSVDADKVLSSYADASSVSDWAKDAVAWAVDSKIMGKGGSINPASNITRGEAAAMSVDSDLKVEE